MMFSEQEIITLSALFVEEMEDININHVDLLLNSCGFYDDIKPLLYNEKCFMGLFTGVMYLCAFRRYMGHKTASTDERAQDFDEAKKFLIESYKLLNLESWGDYAKWKKQQDN